MEQKVKISLNSESLDNKKESDSIHSLFYKEIFAVSLTIPLP